MSKTKKSLISVLTLFLFLFLSNLAFATAGFQKAGLNNVIDTDNASIIMMNEDDKGDDDKDDDDKDDDEDDKK